VDKIDPQVLAVVQDGLNVEGQAEWLWYDHKGNPSRPPTFSRWAKHAGEVPYVRVDIAMNAAQTMTLPSKDSCDLAQACMEIAGQYAVINMRDDDVWQATIKDAAYFEMRTAISDVLKAPRPAEAALVAEVERLRAELDGNWKPIATAREAGEASFLVSDGEQVWTTFFIEGTGQLATDGYGWTPTWWRHKPSPPALAQKKQEG
jgi:hypothetical protein